MWDIAKRRVNHLFRRLVNSALFWNLVILFVNLVMATPRFQTDDDWGIGNYFAGVKDVSNPNCPFVHIWLGKFLCFLYALFPNIQINLFGLYEYVLIFLSVWVLLCLLKRYTQGALWFVSVLLIAIASPQFYIYVQFTKTAALACFAGVLGLAGTTKRWIKFGESERRVTSIVGFTILFFGGFVLRSACAILSFPFFVFSVLETFFSPGLKKNFFSWTGKYLAVFSGVFLILVFGTLYQNLYYQAWDTGYLEFNSARAGFIDYSKVSYSEIQEELAALGVSENDYALISQWTFEDTEFITTELLNELSNLQPQETLQDKVEDFKENTSTYLDVYATAFALLMVGLLAIHRQWKQAAQAFGLFLIAGMLVIYFLLVGRFPSYVRLPLFFILTFMIWTECFLPSVKAVFEIRKNYGIGLCALGIGLLMVLNGWNTSYYKIIGEPYLNEDGEFFFSQLNEQAERIYVTASTANSPSLMKSYGVFQRAKPGIYSNIVGVGGWSARHPMTLAQYERLGLSNPMQQFDSCNVYVVISPTSAERYQTYLREHTQREVQYSIVQELMGAKIFAYRNNFENLSSNEILQLETVVVDYDESIDYQEIKVFAVSGLQQDKEYYLQLTEPATGSTKTYECGFLMEDGVSNCIWLKIPAQDFSEGLVYEGRLIQTEQGEDAFYCSDSFWIEL